MIPNGSGLGRMGTGLHPQFLARAARRRMVLMKESNLKRTKAAKGNKPSKTMEGIVDRFTLSDQEIDLGNIDGEKRGLLTFSWFHERSPRRASAPSKRQLRLPLFVYVPTCMD